MNNRTELLTDERRQNLVSDANDLSMNSEWTKMRLCVIAEMLEEKGEIWFSQQLREISDKIKLLY